MSATDFYFTVRTNAQYSLGWVYNLCPSENSR